MTAYIIKYRNGKGHSKNICSVLLSESEYFCFYTSFNAMPTLVFNQLAGRVAVPSSGTARYLCRTISFMAYMITDGEE